MIRKGKFLIKKKRTHTFQNIYAILVQVNKSHCRIQTWGLRAKSLIPYPRRYKFWKIVNNILINFPLQLDPTEIKSIYVTWYWEPSKSSNDLQKSVIKWVFGVINGELCINEIDNNLKPKWFFFFIKIAYHKIILNSEILSRSNF